MEALTLGEDHSYTLLSAAILVLSLWELGQHERACQLAEDTLTRCRRILGDNHPHTLRSAHNLVAARASLGEHNQAR